MILCASAQISNDSVQLFGLTRGETVVFVWVGEKRINWLARVVLAPPTPVAPHLTSAEIEAQGHGFRRLHRAGGHRFRARQRLFLSSPIRVDPGDRRAPLHARANAGRNVARRSTFNFNSASLQWQTPSTTYNLLDFALTLNGGSFNRLTPYTPLNSYTIRGADVQIGARRQRIRSVCGRNASFSVFKFFRHAGHYRIHSSRKQTSKLYLYTTTAGTSVPTVFTGASARREISFFQTAGFSLPLQ